MRFSPLLKGKEDVRFVTRVSQVPRLKGKEVTVYIPARDWVHGGITYGEMDEYTRLLELIRETFASSPDDITVRQLPKPLEVVKNAPQ